MADTIREMLPHYPWITNNVKFVFVLILAVAAYYFIKKIIIPIIRKVVAKTETQIDDILLSDKVLKRISFFAPLFVLHSSIYLEPSWSSILTRLLSILYALNFTLVIGAILNSINELYEKREMHKERPIKSYLQIIKIVTYVFGAMAVIGIIVGRSPLEIFAGLGVFAAILALLFRDPILSFVASIQISSYDLVRVGDWIEVPKYGADGDVIDISLTVIKIQNGDKTITTIPTYKLIEDSFKNWRGMKVTGARRIKRAVNIDQTTIKFCTIEMLNRYEKINLIKDYIREKKEELKNYNSERNIDNETLVNGRQLTNIGIFRAYLKEYLKQRNDLNLDYTFTVRQLQSGSEGLPIEIYVFTSSTDFIKYEDTQADIFDHILAVIPQFDLNIFQHPTGSDFKKVIN
jgi:miniconductance mechanosensitive channel